MCFGGKFLNDFEMLLKALKSLQSVEWLLHDKDLRHKRVN